jgi:capsular polysaccharide export protein
MKSTRVVFNGGDLMSSGLGRKVLYRRPFEEWPAWALAFARKHGITDLVCYGDCRPYHRQAIAVLRGIGVTIHVLEEGYLRPHWVTCENDGVNGNSRLAHISIPAIDDSKFGNLPLRDGGRFKSPLWHYMLAGFLYYLAAFLLTPLFPRHVSHRDLSVGGEAALWFTRLVKWPLRKWRTRNALSTLTSVGKPFHLVLLQLNGDSQTRDHSDFRSVQHFAEFCISEYAAARGNEAPLVLKSHPLDNGVINLWPVIRNMAERLGVGNRVFFIETGKLVPLLENTLSVTAINSTACHQPLRRGIPTLVLGRAVFNHPEITPRMRLADFFRLRPVMEVRHYDCFIKLMQATCQVHGGYYNAAARRFAVPGIADRLIDGSPSPEQFLAEEIRLAAAASG